MKIRSFRIIKKIHNTSIGTDLACLLSKISVHYVNYFLIPTSNENNLIFLIHHSNTRGGDKNTVFVVVESRVLKSRGKCYKTN